LESKEEIEILADEINDGFRSLMGGYLNLAEGFFKEKVSEDLWIKFRKLVLDFGNDQRRLVEAKLKGVNYYKLIVKEGNQKDG